MKYKGYTAVIEVDEESGMLHGRVIGLRDGIHFQGETVAKAKKSFEESVDDYLNFCASRSEAPEKPFSGKFMVRIPPALHRTCRQGRSTSSESQRPHRANLGRRIHSRKRGQTQNFPNQVRSHIAEKRGEVETPTSQVCATISITITSFFHPSTGSSSKLIHHE